MKINKKLSIAALALFMSVASYAPVNAQDVSAEATTVSSRMASGVWEHSNGSWSYVVNGVEQTGWIVAGGAWYYLNDEGVMQTGWLELDGTWYFLNQSGAMATGWTVVNGNWYYLNNSGEMQTGWTVVDGSWYFLDENGTMATGWLELDGTWYYLNANGSMATNWVSVDGSWFYLKADGSMATEWLNLGGTWYYLDLAGRMLTNTTVGNWEIDANGVATEIAEDRRETLAAAIAAADKLVATDYTNWNKFSPVLKAVTKVSKDKNSTDAQIESAIEDLAKATAELEAKSVSKVELYGLVEDDKNLEEAKYTEESWANYADALANAKAVLANKEALASEVKKATEDYEKARFVDLKLVKKGRAALEQTIADAEQDLVTGDYTPKSKLVVTRAIEDANKVLKDDTSLDADYDKAREAIEAAVDALVGTPAGSKKDLYAAVEDATKLGNYKEADYTVESWKAFAKAITDAQVVLDNEDALAKDVTKALKDLSDAKEGLVNISGLNEAVAIAEKHVELGELEYTTATWKALNLALTNAKAVLEDTSATEAEVLVVQGPLEAANAGMVKAADYTALAKEIARAKAIKADGYTTATWDALQTAIKDAEEAYADRQAVGEKVADLVSPLTTAITNLVADKGTLDTDISDAQELLDTPVSETDPAKKYEDKDGAYQKAIAKATLVNTDAIVDGETTRKATPKDVIDAISDLAFATQVFKAHNEIPAE